MSVSLQNAGLEDAVEVANLHNQSVRVDYDGLIPDEYIKISVSDQRIKAWRGWIGRSQVTTILARFDGEIVGFSTFQPNNDEPTDEHCGELIGVYVHRKYWRQGIRKALFDKILDVAKGQGFSRIVYWELESNRSGRHFYESLGFREDNNRRVFVELSTGSLYETRYSLDT